MTRLELIADLSSAHAKLGVLLDNLTEEDAADWRVIEGARETVSGIREMAHYAEQNARSDDAQREGES